MINNEIPFRLNLGVNTYDPDVTGRELQLVRLKNAQPRLGRLMMPFGLDPFDTIGSDRVEAFAHYTDQLSNFSSLYGVTKNNVYAYDFVGEQFDTTPIYTDMPSTIGPYAIIPWSDRVYLSKQGMTLLRLKAGVATLLDDTPGGRYGIVSNNHLMLANISSISGTIPIRVQWSDLYEPESFSIQSDSEADYFDLEPSDEEITGLSYQRGANIIYSRNSLWIARYNPLPTGYKFDPLYTGLGNVYHGAQVRIKELDAFIGEDNFYFLDGFQLQAFGNDIWSYFTDSIVVSGPQEQVRGFFDTKNTEVFWVFPTGGGNYWSVVYNYKENKWSDRDPQDVSAKLSVKSPLRGFLVIDDILSTIDTLSDAEDDLIDGEWQYYPSDFTELRGVGAGEVKTVGTGRGKTGATSLDSDGTSFECEIQTFEMYMDKLDEIDEVNAVTLYYSGGGTPNIRLLVGSRPNRFEDIVWSDPVLMTDMIPGETTFKFRDKPEGSGNLLRFRFLWENSDDNYISEFTHLSLHHLENEPDDPEA